MLWSYCTVKVVAPTLEAANDIVVSWLCDADDALLEDEVFVSIFFCVLILRSIKSEIKPGFVSLLSSTSISPMSILTTEDMDGRSFGLCWVQRRPIFRNLQASSASKSPFSDMSTSSANSLRSKSSHVCKERILNYSWSKNFIYCCFM